MKPFPHLANDDTAYVTLHLSYDELSHLRTWMHSDEGQNVSFPHGVVLFKRGFGWYRLDTTNTFRAAEKLRTALAILRKWHHEYQKAVAEEIRLRIIEMNPTLQVTSYHSDSNEFRVKDTKTGAVVSAAQVRLASENSLHALQQRFAARRH